MKNRFNLNESEKTHIRNLHGISALNEALFLEYSNSGCKVCDVDGFEYKKIDENPQRLVHDKRVCGRYNGCNGPSCKDDVHNVRGELRGCCQKGAVLPEKGSVRWFDDSRKLRCLCYEQVAISECKEKDKELTKKLKELDKDPDVRMKKKFFEDYPQYNIRGNYMRGENMWEIYKQIIDGGGSQDRTLIK